MRRDHRGQQMGPDEEPGSDFVEDSSTRSCGTAVEVPGLRADAPHLGAPPASGRRRCSRRSTRSPRRATKRVPTAELNRFVEAVTAGASAGEPRAPSTSGSSTRPRPAWRPPTFVFFTNVATTFHFSYERFLVNRLREKFGFVGTPIRLQVRRRKKITRSRCYTVSLRLRACLGPEAGCYTAPDLEAEDGG